MYLQRQRAYWHALDAEREGRAPIAVRALLVYKHHFIVTFRVRVNSAVDHVGEGEPSDTPGNGKNIPVRESVNWHSLGPGHQPGLILQ